MNSCTNAKTNAEMGKTMSYLGDNLLPNDPATPCGLIAKTFFNGTLSIIYHMKRKIFLYTSYLWEIISILILPYYRLIWIV